jgi:hypothetical protein
MTQISPPGAFAASLRILIASCLLALATNAAAYPQVRTFRPEGTVRFEIKDRLDHPSFFWPRTLLSYPVRFEGDVKAEQLLPVRRAMAESVR